MSDTHRSRLKVSREGIDLIKSFEGFRPRAVRTWGGRWVIGYGHTASAREGAMVLEPDAELLLQYDLLPVVKALNDQVAVPLSQHQFDALASFAMSIGVDRFLASDVLQQVNAGRAGEAANALIGWPEPPAFDAPLRRRAAESALFLMDPASPAKLADLLAAPLPWVDLLPFPGANRSGTGMGSIAHDPQGTGPGDAVSDASVPPWLPVDVADPAPFMETRAGEEAAGPLGEQMSATVFRHENRPESGRRHSGQAGAFIAMGVVGLAACAAAAASFRKAMTEASPVGDFMIIGWVLALIGLVCVGVSSWNLYRRWGQTD